MQSEVCLSDEASSSLSSCRAISTDLPDPLLSSFSIVHRSRQVFKATSCIDTEPDEAKLINYFVFIRLLKLSKDEPGHFLDGWPLSNIWHNKKSEAFSLHIL